jgi:hypothetical protein
MKGYYTENLWGCLYVSIKLHKKSLMKTAYFSKTYYKGSYSPTLRVVRSTKFHGNSLLASVTDRRDRDMDLIILYT